MNNKKTKIESENNRVASHPNRAMEPPTMGQFLFIYLFIVKFTLPYEVLKIFQFKPQCLKIGNVPP
jgi:hypothetical protein